MQPKEEIKHCFLFLCQESGKNTCCQDEKGNICFGIGDNPDCNKVTCGNCVYNGKCLAHDAVKEVLERKSFSHAEKPDV